MMLEVGLKGKRSQPDTPVSGNRALCMPSQPLQSRKRQSRFLCNASHPLILLVPGPHAWRAQSRQRVGVLELWMGGWDASVPGGVEGWGG